MRPAASRPPVAPLTGAVRVPGDKSISHRALMFGALAVGETVVEGLLEGEDVLRTAAAMRALGAHVERDGPVWRIAGRGIGGLVEPADVLDMGNSGTAARLLTGVLASHGMFTVMTGDASLRGRPMRRVTEPLAACGARFTCRAGGLLPLAIEGARDAMPLDCKVQVASAQVKSALLLAGLNARGETRVQEPAPTRDHTERMLRHFGAQIDVQVAQAGRLITLQGQPELRAAPVRVPGDPSSAAFPIVAALIVPDSRIVIERMGLNGGRTGLLAVLAEMGAAIGIANRHVEGGEDVGDVTVSGTLRPVDVPPERAPSMIDEYPVLAVACACANGVSRLRGLGELRVKESDRLAATADMLAVNGVRVRVEGDDLIVHGDGPPAGGGVVETRMDHRLAMSALVLGQGSRAPVRVDDTSFIDTSFPGFVQLMRSLGADVDQAPLPVRDGPARPHAENTRA